MQARRSLFAAALACLLAFASLQARANDPQVNVIVLDSALATHGASEIFPVDQPGKPVKLPDEWSDSRPREDGPVWYRLRFDAPGTADQLLAAYIERVCSNADVRLNGFIIYSGGRMNEPVTRNCFYPQLIALPSGLLRAEGNTLDIRVQGYPLQKVSSRQRAGALSQVQIGPHALLAEQHASATFWSISLLQVITIATTVLGAFLLFLGWINRQEAHLTYFGLVILTWNALTARTWLRDLPFDNGTAELLVCVGFTILTALVVQFLLSYGALRSRVIEAGLLIQCLLVPMTLVLAGPQRLFTVSSAWYLLMAFEIMLMIALYLYTEWNNRRTNFWPMAIMLSL